MSTADDGSALAAMTRAAGDSLLDVHSDSDHNRSVLTMAGRDLEARVRAVAVVAIDRLDITGHVGAHPRIGALDVVPFVALDGASPEAAISARDAFARWAGDALALPCFVYGPERTLPDVRRSAWVDLAPSFGPPVAHPTAGACAVGARGVLVAYNLWLTDPDLMKAKAIASRLRGPAVRALGLRFASHAQVSLNLVDPQRFGPAEAYDAVSALASIARAELVGLLPRSVLGAIDASRWDELDVGDDRTIEARLAARA